MQIQEQLRQFIIENFLFGESDGLTDRDSFLEKGIIDSTGVLELVAFLEGHFGIKMQDQDLIPDNLDSIQGLTAFIQRKLGQGNGVS
jgi:acyl carrier protein